MDLSVIAARTALHDPLSPSQVENWAFDKGIIWHSERGTWQDVMGGPQWLIDSPGTWICSQLIGRLQTALPAFLRAALPHLYPVAPHPSAIPLVMSVYETDSKKEPPPMSTLTFKLGAEYKS